MSTLQKLKFLATPCAVASGSPSGSPVIHLRRRPSLRKLLGRHRNNNNNKSNCRMPQSDSPRKPDAEAGSLKLKDFLLSSPPPPPRKAEPRVSEKDRIVPRGGGGRPLKATIRQRLMRKSWRPVLVTIPE